MRTIQINDDLYRFPQNWDEMETGQLEYLARIAKGGMAAEKFKLLMTLRILHARVQPPPMYDHPLAAVTAKFGRSSKRVCLSVRVPGRWRRRKYWMSPEEVCLLTDQLGWLVEESEVGGRRRMFIRPQLDKNPYPTVRVLWHWFTGPDDSLFDLTFEQYMYLQTWLDAVSAKPDDDETFCRMLACLWHRAPVFDLRRMEEDARLLRLLPAEKKLVMYWVVQSGLRYIAESFPKVFTGEEKVVGNVFDYQLRLLDSLASHDMTKKDQVRKGLLWDALYSMDETVREQEELEKRLGRKRE